MSISWTEPRLPLWPDDAREAEQSARGWSPAEVRERIELDFSDHRFTVAEALGAGVSAVEVGRALLEAIVQYEVDRSPRPEGGAPAAVNVGRVLACEVAEGMMLAALDRVELTAVVGSDVVYVRVVRS
jgi:hypothetical protein